jgi:hypothetical protein
VVRLGDCRAEALLPFEDWSGQGRVKDCRHERSAPAGTVAAHLPAGALRVVRWSARYEETVTFYRDAIGLPVLETFHDSYGLDGTILGLPGGQVHLEIVRAGQAPYPGRRAGPACVLPA